MNPINGIEHLMIIIIKKRRKNKNFVLRYKSKKNRGKTEDDFSEVVSLTKIFHSYLIFLRYIPMLFLHLLK